MKKVSVRNYSMTDAKLIQVADEKLFNLTRDAAEFSARGYDNAMITSIKSKRTAFDSFPSDIYLNGDRQIATQNKNAARELVEAKTRTVQLAANQTFRNAGTVSKFGISALSTLTDDEAIRNAKNAYRAATDYLSDLTPKGITAAFLAAYLSAIEDFDLKKDLQNVAENNRDEATENRINLGNELYTAIVDLCAVGKDIWYNVSEAKYNDYVLYDNQQGAPDSSKDDTLAPGETKAYFSGQIDATTQIRVSITSAAGKLLVYASGSVQTPPPINSGGVEVGAPLVVVIGTISTAGVADAVYIYNDTSAPVNLNVAILS